MVLKLASHWDHNLSRLRLKCKNLKTFRIELAKWCTRPIKFWWRNGKMKKS